MNTSASSEVPANSVLIEYIRDENRHPRGVVVATGRDEFGWAWCHDNDTFNKRHGLSIAIGRARTSGEGRANRALPPEAARVDIDAVTGRLRERAAKYFK